MSVCVCVCVCVCVRVCECVHACVRVRVHVYTRRACSLSLSLSLSLIEMYTRAARVRCLSLFRVRCLSLFLSLLQAYDARPRYNVGPGHLLPVLLKAKSADNSPRTQGDGKVAQVEMEEQVIFSKTNHSASFAIRMCYATDF